MNKCALCLTLLFVTVSSSPDIAYPQAEPGTAAEFWEQGNEYFKAEKLDDAIRSYSKAIRADPNFTKAYANRGAIHYKMHRYAEAITDYNKAIDLEPENAVAYHTRAWVHAANGQTDKAIADFTTAIRLNDPDLDDAYLTRSRLYFKKREYDKGIADLTELIRLKPGSDVGYNNRATLYARLGRLDEAISDYTKAIELNPTRGDTYASRAQIYRKKKEKQNERDDWTQAARLGQTGITLLDDETPVQRSGNPGITVSKSCMPGSGHLWLASEVTDLLPPVPDNVEKYVPNWSYRTHCILRKHKNSDDLLEAIVAPDDPHQCVYYLLELHITASGEVSPKITVPLWCDGMLHEYEGRVALGKGNKTWVFEPNPDNRLVFEVSAKNGYIHKGGSGKVTLPTGKVVVLANSKPGEVLGHGNAGKP